MVGVGCLLEIACVAGIALRRDSLGLADGCARVTVVALQGSVGADQRESVLVVLNVLNGDVPTLDGVALLATGAHLPAVNVSVTIRTLISDIRKNWLGVALGTGHALVHPT